MTEQRAVQLRDFLRSPLGFGGLSMIDHPTTSTPTVHVPETLREATDLLRDGSSSVLAGGTWVMRGGVRGDGFSSAYVLVSRLAELNRLDMSDDHLVVGSAVTHDRLAKFLAGDPRFVGLHTAARKSANPAIRRMATVGGNLSTTAFPAADLVPALLATSSEVTLTGAGSTQTMALRDFLPARESLPAGSLVTHITVPMPAGRSAHERLTLRRAGDYPVAIVHVHADVDEDGVVRDASVALGSVETTPREWHSVSARLVGSRLDPDVAMNATRELAAELNARDGVEAAGWYRVQVLPVLVANAVRKLQRQGGA